jgi:hypothetical protein
MIYILRLLARPCIWRVFLFGIGLVLCGSARAAQTESSELSQSSESVVIEQLSDSQNKQYSFSNNGFNNAELAVFIFLSPDNPMAYTFMPTAESMEMKTRKLGGGFFGVVSGTTYSPSLVELFRKECHADFPFLVDRKKTLETIFGAKEVGTVILVQGRKCIFTGPIDHRFDPVPCDAESIALEEELDMLARERLSNSQVKVAQPKLLKLEETRAVYSLTPNSANESK